VSFNPETGYVYNEKWTFGGCMEYGKAVSVIDSKYLYEEDIEVNLFKINPYALYAPIRYQNFAFCAEIGLEFVPRQSGIDCAMYGAYIKPLLTYSLSDLYTCSKRNEVDRVCRPHSILDIPYYSGNVIMFSLLIYLSYKYMHRFKSNSTMKPARPLAP
jgi:hypothetical protein